MAGPPLASRLVPRPVVKIDPQVVFRRLDDQMVLVHLGTNQIFELNETSARLFELLADHGDVTAATRRLVEEFAVDPADVSKDVDRTLAVLVSERLVTQVDGV